MKTHVLSFNEVSLPYQEMRSEKMYKDKEKAYQQIPVQMLIQILLLHVF